MMRQFWPCVTGAILVARGQLTRTRTLPMTPGKTAARVGILCGHAPIAPPRGRTL
jgi:hypothetical protein